MIDRITSQNLTPRISINEISNDNPQQNEANQQRFPKKTPEPIQKEQVTEVINSMNEFLQTANTSLKFVLHEKLNEYYVTVVDDVTQEVVKEIPPKKMLDMYASMIHEFLGLMVDKKI